MNVVVIDSTTTCIIVKYIIWKISFNENERVKILSVFLLLYTIIVLIDVVGVSVRVCLNSNVCNFLSK